MPTDSSTHSSQLDPKLAFLMAGIVLLIMGVTMISFGWVPHLSLLLAICFLLLMGMMRGLSFNHLQSEMAAGVVSGSGAIYLFFFIGLMVAALMMSGAIPTLMYFGFELISPRFYYISAFVLTSIIGIALNIITSSCPSVASALVANLKLPAV